MILLYRWIQYSTLQVSTWFYSTGEYNILLYRWVHDSIIQVSTWFYSTGEYNILLFRWVHDSTRTLQVSTWVIDSILQVGTWFYSTGGYTILLYRGVLYRYIIQYFDNSQVKKNKSCSLHSVFGSVHIYCMFLQFLFVFHYLHSYCTLQLFNVHELQ